MTLEQSIDFIAEDEPILETYETLQSDFGGGFGETTTVMFDGDIATPEAHNAMVDALDNLSDVDDVRAAGGTPLVSMPPTLLGELLDRRVDVVQLHVLGNAGHAPGIPRVGSVVTQLRDALLVEPEVVAELVEDGDADLLL